MKKSSEIKKVDQIFTSSFPPWSGDERLVLLDLGGGKDELFLRLFQTLIQQAMSNSRSRCIVFLPYGNFYMQKAMYEMGMPVSAIITATKKTAKIGYVFSHEANVPMKRKMFHDTHSATRSSAAVRYIIEHLTDPGDLVLDVDANATAIPAKWCRRLGRAYIGQVHKPKELEEAKRKLSQIEFPAHQMDLC